MKIDEMSAGPEMDKLVAEKVMGWHREGDELEAWVRSADTLTGITFCVMVEDWNPSTDVSAAWKVMEKILQDNYWETVAVQWLPPESKCVTDAVGWSAIFIPFDGVADWPVGKGNAAPLAICRAALKIVEIMEI